MKPNSPMRTKINYFLLAIRQLVSSRSGHTPNHRRYRLKLSNVIHHCNECRFCGACESKVGPIHMQSNVRIQPTTTAKPLEVGWNDWLGIYPD